MVPYWEIGRGARSLLEKWAPAFILRRLCERWGGVKIWNEHWWFLATASHVSHEESSGDMNITAFAHLTTENPQARLGT